jgi:hypothetical protein
MIHVVNLRPSFSSQHFSAFPEDLAFGERKHPAGECPLLYYPGSFIESTIVDSSGQKILRTSEAN